MDKSSKTAPERLGAEDLRARRRAARIAGNRADILDAAERTFAERGLTDGSLRDIAKLSGFSTAAIYNYFDNKGHLLAETLIRRGTQLLEVINAAAGEAGSPLDKLHHIVEATVTFFTTYPEFRQILRHARESEAAIASMLGRYASDEVDLFPPVLTLMTSLVEDGQKIGEIRQGDPSALIHLYMALVYEHVFLAGPGNLSGFLTLEQFQGVVDGALRNPATATRRSKHAP